MVFDLAMDRLMRLKSIKFLLSLSALFSVSLVAHADEAKVIQAKFAMGDALTKMAILTNSFTEKGKQNADIVGMQLAQKLSVSLDDMVSQGLQHEGSCEQILQFSDLRAAELFDPNKDPAIKSTAAKRSIENAKLSIHNYVAAQCENLHG